MSLAETLAAAPGVQSVTVTTSDVGLGSGDLAFTYEDADVQKRLRENGIKVEGGRLVDKVEGGMASLVNGGTLGPFDAVVLSKGSLPRATPPGAHVIGDCLSPRGFWAATTDAARLARAL